MAPALEAAFAPLATAGIQEQHLQSRDLQNVNRTQAITLGVIAAYVVGIAILWNVPYLRMILWPFKVSHKMTSHHPITVDDYDP
jgi:hypothetical protein